MRTVGRGVTLGLGVRVLRGDATGYAYTEELSDERMLEAARTAAQIASSRRRARAGRDHADHAAQLLFRRAPVAGSPGHREGRAAPPRRQGRARRRSAHRARRGVAVRGVEGGAGRQLRRAPRARSPADDALRRQRRRRGGQAAPGRALGRRRALRHGVLPAPRAEPRGARPRGGASGDRHAARRGGARRTNGGRAGRGRVGDPAARGGRPRPRGRLQPQARPRTTPTRSASRWRRRCARSSTTARSATRAARSTSTTRATPASATC